MLTARDATKLAQQILADSNNAIVIDGWWGTYTNSAYQSAPSAVKRAIQIVLKTAGTSVDQLMATTRAVNVRAQALGSGWVAEDYVFSLIDRAVAMIGGDANLMRKFLKLEAVRQERNGTTYYNANSVAPSGLFKGLFQMGEPAWLDVREKVVKTLKSYSEGVFDPWENTLAGTAYVLLNQKYARAAGYKGAFTPEVLYALHNQGAGGFMRLVKERMPNDSYKVQSTDAKQVIKAALSQNGVTFA